MFDPFPEFAEEPLNTDDLQTMIAVAHCIVVHRDRQDFQLLALLTPSQKKQLWDLLTLDERSALQEIGREVAHV